MNIYSDNAQVGFLIGIYFLASAIVALTLVYFSRPRPKNGEPKDKIGPETQVDMVKEDSRLKPAENAPAQTAEAPERKMGPPKIENSLEPKPVADKMPESVTTKMEESNMNKLPTTPPVGSPVHTPLITVTNAPKAPAEAAATHQIAVNAEATGDKSKTETVPAASANQTANESPKSGNPDSDFSEIFTEDTEETEAMRLAKDMDEVDTDDLLQTSQDLISQLKRKI